jgi:cell division protein FtsB
MQLGDTKVEDFKTVNYDHLIPVLTKAVQELKAENDALKARIEALEGQ